MHFSIIIKLKVHPKKIQLYCSGSALINEASHKEQVLHFLIMESSNSKKYKMITGKNSNHRKWPLVYKAS